jgi:3-hydroxyisobutyrate dehydrogenase-like beta-hydroxyacid dehydrogenase
MSVERPVITEVVGFIGYGEAAAAFVQGWRGAIDVKVIAYDIKTDDPALGDDKQRDYAKFDVTGVENALALAAGADVIISTVTAEVAVEATRSAAAALRPGHIYFDFNSCTPSRKRESAAIVEARARFMWMLR